MGLLGDKPVLVVAPLSTVPNWMAELRKWCPALNRVGYIGNAAARETCRSFDFPNTTAGGLVDVVVTSYEVAIADSKELQRLRWGAVVVDEGHRLKNFQSRLSRVLSTLDSPFRCLLTGTPLQNNLEELFALLHFLEPEKFKNPPSLAESFTADAKALSRRRGKGEGRDSATGTVTTSRRDRRAAQEPARCSASTCFAGLRQVSGFCRRCERRRLRANCRRFNGRCTRMCWRGTTRLSTRALTPGSGPACSTCSRNCRRFAITLFCSSAPRRTPFGRRGRAASRRRLPRRLKPSAGFAGSDDRARPPPPITLRGDALRSSSGKMQLLHKLLPKLRERGHRILLFCQMTRMLDLLEDWLRASGVGFVVADEAPANSRNGSVRPVYGRIDGGTPLADRQRVIADFNTPGSDTFLLLISTRAGGQGVNLATADTIVLYDPDFNPFIDSQAQSRAHRMGQTREVAVYQLVTAKTVEEKIVSMAKSKLAIERLVVKDVRGEEGGGGKGKGGGGAEGRKAAEARRAAELAEVLAHGARGVMAEAETDEADARDDVRRRVIAAAEPTDAEINRLLDRASLPEVDGGADDAAYLGEIGDATSTEPGPLEGDDEGPRVDGGGERKGVALVDLLASRASRLADAGEEELGRGKRQRQQVFPNLNQKNLARAPTPTARAGPTRTFPPSIAATSATATTMRRACSARRVHGARARALPRHGRGTPRRTWWCGDGECAEAAPLDAKNPRRRSAPPRTGATSRPIPRISPARMTTSRTRITTTRTRTRTKTTTKTTTTTIFTSLRCPWVPSGAKAARSVRRWTPRKPPTPSGQSRGGGGGDDDGRGERGRRRRRSVRPHGDVHHQRRGEADGAGVVRGEAGPRAAGPRQDPRGPDQGRFQLPRPRRGYPDRHPPGRRAGRFAHRGGAVPAGYVPPHSRLRVETRRGRPRETTRRCHRRHLREKPHRRARQSGQLEREESNRGVVRRQPGEGQGGESLAGDNEEFDAGATRGEIQRAGVVRDGSKDFDEDGGKFHDLDVNRRRDVGRR